MGSRSSVTAAVGVILLLGGTVLQFGVGAALMLVGVFLICAAGITREPQPDQPPPSEPPQPSTSSRMH